MSLPAVRNPLRHSASDSKSSSSSRQSKNSDEATVRVKNSAAHIEYDDDPLIFVFHKERPGMHKMHIKPLSNVEKDWIKIDSTYPAHMQLKRELLATKLDKVYASCSSSSNNQKMVGCIRSGDDGNRTRLLSAEGNMKLDSARTTDCENELLQMLGEHLPKRFPTIFERRRAMNNNNGREVDVIYNRVTGDTVSLELSKNSHGAIVADGKDKLESALVRASRLTQEDWCILEYLPSLNDDDDDANSEPILTSGVVCFPSGWSVIDKFLRPFSRIHEPVGEAFTRHIRRNALKVLNKLTVEKPIWRANWGIFNNIEHPMHLHTPKDRPNSTVTKFSGAATGRELIFRAEYQTLRRLPKTNCIVFSIRTYQRYLEDIPPGKDREALLRAIETGDPLMEDYKNAQCWKDAAVQYLRLYVDGEQACQITTITSRLKLLVKKGRFFLLAAVIGVLAIVLSLMRGDIKACWSFIINGDGGHEEDVSYQSKTSPPRAIPR